MLNPRDFPPGVFTSIVKAMNDQDNHVLRLRYRDKKGVTTERVVSPIKFVDDKAMLVLCLCREIPRRLELAQCSCIELVSAHDVLMPVEIRIIDDGLGNQEQAERRCPAGA